MIDAARTGKAMDSQQAMAIQFLSILFDESDTILIRPIETWVCDGERHSRVDYKNTFYFSCSPVRLQRIVPRIFELSSTDRLNIFFGVCPRLGDKGHYDLAWQIRTAHTLWADIDNVSVEEALFNVETAGLPQPSIVVSTGNGAHMYWLLDSPYVIDDVGKPPPVQTEWAESSSGDRRSRKFVLEDGEKVFLDRRQNTARLSAKAQIFQNTLAGIYKAIGGDHTHDLTRLLRVAGTLNRKNERNGDVPKPSFLVDCDPLRRYSFTHFREFAIAAPSIEREKKIDSMPLPKARKPSVRRSDKLAELIAAADIAPIGSRSEADFAICAYAIENGITEDYVWSHVEQLGKFKDAGRRYFETTWSNAALHVRTKTYDRLIDRMQNKTGNSGDAHLLSPNYDDVDRIDESPDSTERLRALPVTRVVPSKEPVATTLRSITNALKRSRYCYSRADQLVAIRKGECSPILKSTELSGLLSQLNEFYFIDKQGKGVYKPLPSNYADVWLCNEQERSRLDGIDLYTRNPVFGADWKLVSSGYNKDSRIFYSGPDVEPRDSTHHLDRLLSDFCFENPSDRTNYIGLLLTAILIPHFLGSKPAVVFNGNQPGLGKSMLAQIIAVIRDGKPTETATYNSNDEEFEKRLGAIVHGGATTIIIDNAKQKGRNHQIDSACLERSITDPIVSFRLLGKSESIRSENSHLFCITANSPDISRDLITRSVVINLMYEGVPAQRNFSLADPERFALSHRFELLGELIGMVERWKQFGMPLAKTHNRFNKRDWGNIVGGILQACGEPDFLDNANAAAEQLDEVQRDFADLVRELVKSPQDIWSASELALMCAKHDLLSAELGDSSLRSRAIRLGRLVSRFHNCSTCIDETRTVVFRRISSRVGKAYQVSVETENAEC